MAMPVVYAVETVRSTDRWSRLDGRTVFAGQGRDEGGVVPGSRCMGRSRRASRGGGSLVRSLSCGRSFS
ncbi:hypothetical protein WN48_00497 [Eufriesea mexicana]|nr:hypothetical protein WN48_00497 [Eufriesea mexicana]